MSAAKSTIAQLWAKADRPAVRAFLLSITALTAALLLALYSGAAAELGQLGLASASALAALTIAGWVGVTLVPLLAKRTPLRWISYKMEYRITLEGWIYLGGIILVALAALNTGNNLLFLILASLIALVLMSGILSTIALSGIGMRLVLPEHIFAGQPVRAMVELENEKLTLPSFSLRVEATKTKKGQPAAMLDTPVYFPYLPKHDRVQQTIPITFPRRGVYRQEAFRIVTRFPFGFLRKARQLNLQSESSSKPVIDHHVSAEDDWLLKSGALPVNERFERAVTVCASLAWHFYENNSLLQFRSAAVESPLGPADEIIFSILGHLAIARPLPPDPRQLLMAELASAPELFKIIVTTQPHGSVPASVWSSSY